MGPDVSTYIWPSAMMEVEASFNGTLRTILILLIIWWVLRSLLRSGRNGARKRMNWTTGTDRRKGEVRIERLKEDKRNEAGKADGNVTDADFEELK